MHSIIKNCLLLLLFVPCSAWTMESVVLNDKADIQHAAALDSAIKQLSGRVNACIQENHGKFADCLCRDEKSCKFKSEYAVLKNTYCEVMARYPDWAGKSVSFSLPNDATGYAIGMKAMEMQLGKYCRE